MPGLVPGIGVSGSIFLPRRRWLGQARPSGRRIAAMSAWTATLIGLTAILMWSLLSVLTVATGTIPPFQLAAMTFAIGAVTCALRWIGRAEAVNALRQPLVAWIVGVGGLFGY